MATVLKRYLDTYPNDTFWVDPYLPTIKEARQKVVILRDFEGDVVNADPLGVPFRFMDIDDNWRPGNIFSVIKWKLSCIYQHLDLARQGRPDHMYVTFTGAHVSYHVYISI